MPFASEIIVTLVTAIVVGLVVVFHDEVVLLLNRWVLRRHAKFHSAVRDRPIILIVMFILLFAHVVEIWLFGITFFVLLNQEGFGAITGYPEVNLLDSIYFSAANYTTVGWGDLSAAGDIRFLAGTEALVGFMMITWSASFGYLVMARTLRQDNQ